MSASGPSPSAPPTAPRDPTGTHAHQAVPADPIQLGLQRRDQLQRRRLHHVGPLYVTVCRSCLAGQLGASIVGDELGGALDCNIRLDMAKLEATARSWDLPLRLVTASVLLHEQEHCIRDPDDRKIQPIEAERRLARKLGDARQLEFANRNNDCDDPQRGGDGEV